MFFDIIGWIGMILCLIPYFLISLNKINNGVTYQILNLLSATLMAIGLFPKNAWFSFTLEIVWGLIAIISLIKQHKKKRN